LSKAIRSATSPKRSASASARGAQARELEGRRGVPGLLGVVGQRGEVGRPLAQCGEHATVQGDARVR
jgi:hypothetical protein